VSYLVSVGGRRVLFDSGLSAGKPVSALTHNARVLGVPWGDLDAVVISRLHADHVGGLRRCAAARSVMPPNRWSLPGCRRTCHPDAPPCAGVVVTAGPKVIGPGVAVLPPLPRMLFWIGCETEQALVVNVRSSA